MQLQQIVGRTLLTPALSAGNLNGKFWLYLALYAKAAGCPLLLQLRTSGLERTALPPIPDVCEASG